MEHCNRRVLFPLPQVEDVHNRVLQGLSKPENLKGNECGIVINSVTAADHGEWVCKVFVFANTLRGSKNVVVTGIYLRTKDYIFLKKNVWALLLHNLKD